MQQSSGIVLPTTAILKSTLPLPPGVNQSYKIVSVPARTTFRKGTRIYNQSSEVKMVRRLGATSELENFKEQAAWTLKDREMTSVDWDCVEFIKSDKRRKIPLALSIKFFFPTLWKRDVDSGIKAVQDVVFKHIALNDNMVVQLVVKKLEDRQNPRVEVELSTVGR